MAETAAARSAGRRWRRRVRESKIAGSSTRLSSQIGRSGAGRLAARSTPGRSTTTRCARSKISRHRCHDGSPRNASAPSSSSSGAAGTRGAARRASPPCSFFRRVAIRGRRRRARETRRPRAAAWRAAIGGRRRGAVAVRRIAGGNEADFRQPAARAARRRRSADVRNAPDRTFRRAARWERARRSSSVAAGTISAHRARPVRPAIPRGPGPPGSSRSVSSLMTSVSRTRRARGARLRARPAEARARRPARSPVRAPVRLDEWKCSRRSYSSDEPLRLRDFLGCVELRHFPLQDVDGRLRRRDARGALLALGVAVAADAEPADEERQRDGVEDQRQHDRRGGQEDDQVAPGKRRAVASINGIDNAAAIVTEPRIPPSRPGTRRAD